jgi:phosphoglycolate phosphatase
MDAHEEHRRILETWSQPHRAELKNLLREHPELLDKACKIYEEKFFGDTFVSTLSYVEGANEMLLRLKPAYKLAVATGAHPVVLKERVMPRFKVPDVFNKIVSGYDIDDPEKQKPHPHMLEKILAALNIMPEEAIMVGDAKSDVQMAYRANIKPVVVLTGHLSKSEAEELGVKHIIEDVTKLESLLYKRLI